MTDHQRRNVVNWLLGTSVGALTTSILYPIVRFVSPPDVPEANTHQVEAGPTNDPELLDKGFKILRFGNEPVILIRDGDQEFRAFAATCTHLDCIVEFDKAKSRILCHCHNAQYDLRGQVVSGPPPHGLEAYEVDVVAQSDGRPGTIIVSRV